MNVSLTPELEQLVAEKVQSGRYSSASEVIREALEAYLKDDGVKTKPPAGLRLADAVKADIGVWQGPATASVSTGKQLGEILLEKHRTRRL